MTKLYPINEWDSMLEWVAESLDDQPPGLEFSLGPKHVRLADDWDEVEAEIEDDEIDADDEVDYDAPDAVCVQVYVLAGGVFLVRRSRTALRTLRFVDHDASSVPLDVWQHDDPFDDCTDGYLYTRERLLAAEACISWFRDNYAAPELTDLGCHYSYAVELPRGAADDPITQ
ncbi:hypothetical protein [Gordonia aichiensis]|uniref:Uncharacterized protein n=1 Tax=Gordonia aichiensis NBRC 108223 TaxID=1220583 RepID=L7KPV7_9ACTN|nr:hypothetical protein [Gordonia aichiensis]GAC50521.1 hypothetical protein GOACH_25_00580 [Gordonia aichiensis NBRC 108223]